MIFQFTATEAILNCDCYIDETNWIPKTGSF